MTALETIFQDLLDDDQSSIHSVSNLIERISNLPKEDREDLFELMSLWDDVKNLEERIAIRTAVNEILAQTPCSIVSIDSTLREEIPYELKKWMEQVGKTIRSLRETAGLNQTQLAEKAGLTQSHISRLENAEHSATHKTLEKIAAALGVQIRDVDPLSE